MTSQGLNEASDGEKQPPAWGKPASLMSLMKGIRVPKTA